MKLLAEDVALALVGTPLREEAIKRLRSESKREEWEAGRNQGSANLERYVEDISRRLSSFSPPFDERRRDAILSEVRSAWDALWYPPPEDCAEDLMHGGLHGPIRQQTIDRLVSVGERSAADLSELMAAFRSAVDTADAKKRERLLLEQNAPEVETLSARLKDVGEEIGRLRAQRDTAERAEAALDGQLAAKRQELGRHTDSIGRGAPALRRAKRAETVARLIEEVLREAVPTQVGAVAQAMTQAWKSMAHMADRVDRIEIAPDCEVRMLNSRGENLHEIEKSAGASQVFTQALIWAVTHVSGQDFPFVVDTPLARLSRDQRLGVLRTFTNRPGQVILLSTDEEVIGDKLEAIRDRIAAAYQLRVRNDDGVTVSTVESDRIEGR